jgi:hypothetical protein
MVRFKLPLSYQAILTGGIIYQNKIIPSEKVLPKRI